MISSRQNRSIPHPGFLHTQPERNTQQSHHEHHGHNRHETTQYTVDVGDSDPKQEKELHLMGYIASGEGDDISGEDLSDRSRQVISPTAQISSHHRTGASMSFAKALSGERNCPGPTIPSVPASNLSCRPTNGRRTVFRSLNSTPQSPKLWRHDNRGK